MQCVCTWQYDMYYTHQCNDGFHERIDQPSPTEVEVEYSSTYTSLQHPTTVFLFHVYHIFIPLV